MPVDLENAIAPVVAATHFEGIAPSLFSKMAAVLEQLADGADSQHRVIRQFDRGALPADQVACGAGVRPLSDDHAAGGKKLVPAAGDEHRRCAHAGGLDHQMERESE